MRNLAFGSAYVFFIEVAHLLDLSTFAKWSLEGPFIGSIISELSSKPEIFLPVDL